jgi:hypothetical protein
MNWRVNHRDREDKLHVERIAAESSVTYFDIMPSEQHSPGL